MPIATRPAGRSILSDVASAGAGFAVGLKKEQEKKKAEALDAAMRKFDTDIKRQQLGFAGRQVGLQEASFGLQQQEAERSEASRQVSARLATEQLALQKKQREDDLENRRLQRKLEYDKLDADERMELRRVQNAMAMKKLEVAGEANRSHMGILNQERDNLRQEIRDFQSQTGNVEITVASINPNAETEWIALRDKALKDGNKEEYNRQDSKIKKLAEWDDLNDRLRKVGDASYDNLVRAGALSKELGVPSPDVVSADMRWRDYPEELKRERLSQLAAKLVQEPDLDLEPYYDLGVSRKEIQDAVRMAGVPDVAVPPPGTVEALSTERGQKIQQANAPRPPVPTTAPITMSERPFLPKDPAAELRRKEDEVRASISSPITKRAPILGGGGNPDSLLAKYKFQIDKSPSKHRIQP